MSIWRWLRLSRQFRRRRWELATTGDKSLIRDVAEEVASWAKSASAEALEAIGAVVGRYRRSWTRWFPNDSDEDRPVRALPDARRAFTMEWIAHGLVFLEVCLSAFLMPRWFPILHDLGAPGGAIAGGLTALMLGVILEACGAALVPKESPRRAPHWVWGSIVFFGLLWLSAVAFIMLVRPLTGPLALRLEPWLQIAFGALIVLNLTWASAFFAGSELWGWSGRLAREHARLRELVSELEKLEKSAVSKLEEQPHGIKPSEPRPPELTPNGPARPTVPSANGQDATRDASVRQEDK